MFATIWEKEMIMDEIRDFLLSPQEYLDTFWESDVLIWIDWREYDESIIKYINEKLPEEDKVKFTCVEIEKERDVDIILEKKRYFHSNPLCGRIYRS